MSRDYFGDADTYTAQALPTPSDTPYHTPAQRSRQSSRIGTPPSGQPPSPPPPLPPDFQRFPKDTTSDGGSPITDLRRLSPTLHASLVAEILSLRRDVEYKHRFIEGLEESVHTARAENEALHQTLSDRVKETRTLRKQMQHTEGGTLSALQELSKERDEANQVSADLRKRLEASQKKTRGYEEDAERSQSEWNRERHAWEEDKRVLERRLHVSEGRLKAVVDEIAAQQFAHDQAIGADFDYLADENGDGQEGDRASLRSLGRKSRKHARNTSASTLASAKSIRYSVYSDGQARPNGISLADELTSDCEDVYDSCVLGGDDDSDHGARIKRARVGRQSTYQDGKVKRVLPHHGIMMGARDPSADAIRPSTPWSPPKGQPSEEAVNAERYSLDEPADVVMPPRRPSSQYSENSRRGSAQSSPQRTANRSRLMPVLEHGALFPFDQSGYSDRNQSRLSICSVCGGSRQLQHPLLMVSSSSQTDDEIFSLSPSSRTSQDELSLGSDTTIVKCYTVSVSVQTEPVQIFPAEALSQSLPRRQALPPNPIKSALQAKMDRYSMSELIEIWESGSPVRSRPATPEHGREPAAVHERSQSPHVGTEADVGSIAVQLELPDAASLVQPLQLDIDLPAAQTLDYAWHKPLTTSVSTQTEDATPSVPVDPSFSASKRPLPLPPLSIPSIAIHPPLSSPPSPLETVLPPGTKNAACQTSFSPGSFSRSASVQTEEIRIDKRAYILPSVLPTSKTSFKPSIRSDNQVFTSGVHSNGASPERKPYFVLSASPLKMSDTNLGDIYASNDKGPRKNEHGLQLERPFRLADMLPSFDEPASDENDEPDDADVSDSETITSARSLKQTWTFKHGRPFISLPTSVPEDKEVASSSYRDTNTEASERSISRQSSGRASMDSRSPDRPPRVAKQVRLISGHKGPNIRRAVLIHSGTAAHLEQHSRTPSMGSETSSKASSAHPPFPVPMRLSSWRVPAKTAKSSRSEGSKTPTRRGGGSPKKRGDGSRSSPKKDNLRKVRSTTSMPRKSRRQSSTSPPPMPRSPARASEIPDMPPLPKDGISSKYVVTPQEPNAEHRPTSGKLPPGHASVDASGSTSVVDAIAATMVGEWMWKYVRRRKSFGVSDSTQDIAKMREQGGNVSPNGARHKRWVWLSPYERAVMWSSKQPTSETALMGKSGRKLTIQSVLDVVDNNPLPRNAQGAQLPFNRSILILTPTRALKFTAFTRERHYMWLTALSFLAHSDDADGVQGYPAVGAAATNLNSLSPALEPSKAITVMNSLRRGNKARPSLRDVFSPSSAAPNDTSSPSPEFGQIDDAADAPTVPRYNKPTHTRKRSMTGPRIVPQPMQAMSTRSFATGLSPNLNTSADFYNLGFGIQGGSVTDGADTSFHVASRDGSGRGTPAEGVAGGMSSRRTSATASTTTGGRLSSLTGARGGAIVSTGGGSNFIEALGMGTVRMEAFVKDGSKRITPRRSGESAATSRAGDGAGSMPPIARESKGSRSELSRGRLSSTTSVTSAGTSRERSSAERSANAYAPSSAPAADPASAAPAASTSASSSTGKNLRPGRPRMRDSLGRGNVNRISGGIWEDVELKLESGP